MYCLKNSEFVLTGKINPNPQTSHMYMFFNVRSGPHVQEKDGVNSLFIKTFDLDDSFEPNKSFNIFVNDVTIFITYCLTNWIKNIHSQMHRREHFVIQLPIKGENRVQADFSHGQYLCM